MDFYTRLVDLAVHLSEAGREVTMARYPRLGAIQNTGIPHPHYGEIIGERMSREAALARLGLPPDCKLILAFGVVRRYKNLLKLIRTFNDMPGNDTRLLIAGMPLDADADFRSRLHDDRGAFARLAQRIARNEEGVVSALVNLAHRLAGAAGTFGYDRIGDIAAALEDEAQSTLVLTGAARERRLAFLCDRVAALCRLIDESLAPRKANA